MPVCRFEIQNPPAKEQSHFLPKGYFSVPNFQHKKLIIADHTSREINYKCVNYNMLSRIDIASDLFLSKNKCINVNLARRFVFPKSESQIMQ